MKINENKRTEKKIGVRGQFYHSEQDLSAENTVKKKRHLLENMNLNFVDSGQPADFKLIDKKIRDL